MIADFLKSRVRFDKGTLDAKTRRAVAERLEKVLSVLPQDVLHLFLSGGRRLSIRILPDAGLPMGMRTTAKGPSDARYYEIIIREEHCRFPEDLFIGSVLRELGHAVEELPPEDEWPASRGERARFKEKQECRADALVWNWGLRHYSMRHLSATYPSHWVDRIVADIEKMLQGNEGTE